MNETPLFGRNFLSGASSYGAIRGLFRRGSELRSGSAEGSKSSPVGN